MLTISDEEADLYEAIKAGAMGYLLKEISIEEVASATTLLTVAQRAGTNLFDLENYVAREQVGDGGESLDAPSAAGGAL